MRKAWKYLTVLVAIASFAWLSYKLISDWNYIASGIALLFKNGLDIIVIILSLTAIGILVDTLRWMTIVGDINHNFFNHLNTVITSIAYSNFSLFGIGEHVARINTNTNVTKSKKTILTDSIMISILNTLAIFCVTSPYILSVKSHTLPVIISVALSVILFSILCFVKSEWTTDIKLSRVIPAFILTIVKTLIFFYQFYLLLSFMFDYNHEVVVSVLNSDNLFSIVCTYYIIITILPISTGFSNLAVRTGVISMLFTESNQISLAISATLCMWLFNIALVSILYFITKGGKFIVKQTAN